MSTPCRTEHIPEQPSHRPNADIDRDSWRFLPYLCCPNIVHEYLHRHDPRIFNDDQNDILHFLSEMAASHYHPFITSPPCGSTQSMIAVQWSEKGKVPKGIVNRNFGFMIHTEDMFPQYTEVGYHDVRNKRLCDSCLSHTEVVTCSLHGTEYLVELYKKIGEETSSKNSELASASTMGQMAAQTQETGSAEVGETETTIRKTCKENGGGERTVAGEAMVVDAA